ncbi:hypothetical protein C8R44DRAFT_288995 [Mycena epipterygia]|nr:hypothetical protein C8R44DRAFT_288995 [Mycena epipterygia]
MVEYEVETITGARVQKKSKKIIWEYHVKWKGYSSDDNTWEPVSSFSGSEEIIAKFWERVDVGDRDIKNMTQFSVGETFIPVGPPRRKLSRRSTKPDVVPPAHPASAGPSKEGTRSSKRRRSSPPAEDLEEKPAKRTRGRVSEAATRSVEDPPEASPRTPREPPRRPPARPAALSARSIRRTRKRTPSPEIVPASEDDEDEDAMLVDPPQPQSFTEPLTEPPTQDIVDLSFESNANQTPTEPIQDEAASPNTLPSHRARAANPLVKMVDDFAPLDGAISVKARLQGRNGTSSETPVAGPSSSPTRKSGRKPGPGRSSAGIVAKNTSSLLTFEKGALKTVKGKFTAPVDEEEDKAEGSSGDGPMIPAVPPTSDELLKLGGFDASAAEALDDFEDEISPAEVQENNSSIQQSLTLAKNKLFPPGMAMASSFSNKVTSVWRRATIFGPLLVPLLFVRQTFLNVLFLRGLGSDVVPETRSDSKPFLLKLDATVEVPLDLTNVGQSLDVILGKESTGPPGKFFQDTDALKLLDTVRTGGPSARATINDNATEEEKTHFARFRSRLNQGELFTAMVGSVFLGFCSSETPLMQRLNLPPTLVSCPDSVFMTQLDIENFSAYLEVAETADTSRW